METVLIVDDEEKIREFIGLYFRAEGFKVITAADGYEALRILEKNRLSIIILDIMMPSINGFEVCKTIRKTSDVPIIILTAYTEDEKYLLGYELGADDYVPKSTSPKIIVAKAKRLMEKNHLSEDNVIVGKVRIDKPGMSVYVDEAMVYLSHKEFCLLLLLFENKNIVLSREYILDKVWGYSFIGDTRVIDTQIKKIRKKLGAHANIIKTIVNSGYKVEDK